MEKIINQQAFIEIDEIFRKYLFTQEFKEEILAHGAKTITFSSRKYKNAVLLVKNENNNLLYDITYYTPGIAFPFYAISDSKIAKGFTELRDDILLFANGIKLNSK